MTLFISSFIITFVLLWWIIYFSKKRNLFIDDANTNKPQNFHHTSTPRIGGLGILGGLLVITLSPFGLSFVPSMTLAFLSGFFEDLRNSLTPKLRLFLQLIAAMMGVWLMDAVVTYLGLGITMPYWLGVLFSLFAIVGMMNAINIIDGFNGLASGVILLILLSFLYVAYRQNDHELMTVIIISIGAVLGFFVLNFPRGIIFLGDGGAYLLGFIVSVIGIFLAGNYIKVSPWYILAIFIYPVWEVVFSIGRKLLSGRSPMEPDSYHLHMLVYRQITRNNPLTALFIIVLVFPFIALSTRFANQSITNIIIAAAFVLLYSLLYIWLYKKDTTKT